MCQSFPEDYLISMPGEGERTKSPRKYGIFRRLMRNGGLLFSLLKDYGTGRYRNVSIFSIAAFLFTLLYIISPVDLVSDVIPGFGQIDDAVVFTLCLYLIEKDLFKYQEWKKKQER
jgi:uncharacterized membrane protein YkvA (DUF1232 family)